jgi:hypothetical protein
VNISEKKLRYLIREELLVELKTGTGAFGGLSAKVGDLGNFIGRMAGLAGAAGLNPGTAGFAEKIQEKFPKVKFTSKKRSPGDQARVSFQYPYKIDVLVRQIDSTINPGDYYFSGQTSDMSKVNAALKKLGKKTVPKGVYARGNKAKTAFAAYEKIRGKLQPKSGDSFWTDKDVIQKTVDATASTWGKNLKPGSHGSGQAVDMVGIPLDNETKQKIVTAVKEIKEENPAFAKYKIYVKQEADHWHIGIDPGS